MQQNYTIIILAYKRLYSLQRLIKSLLDAAIAFEKTAPLKLIISIDGGADEEVIRFSNNFFSKHFDKDIIQQPSRLGPDKHNLWAMEQSITHNAVLVLEDDCMVSPSVLYYAQFSLKFFEADNTIAGISLYNYERNEVCNYPFVKVKDGNDNYFYRRASSRGYLITKRQWLEFKNYEYPVTEIDLPEFYQRWDNEVWEKRFNSYLIEFSKYWVYPQLSLTTNFGEPGAHVNKEIYRHAFQSNMEQSIKREFNFSSLEKSKAVYDAYGEPAKIHGFQPNEITSDILGIRDLEKIKTKLVLTSRHCNSSNEAYVLDLIPPELNVSHNLRGKDLKVAEVKNISESFFQKQIRELKLHYYFYPDRGLLHLLRLKTMEILNRFSR